MPIERREAALRAMRDHDISQRRACRLVGVDPKTVRRERPPDNPEIRKEMKAVAAKRRRFGYRRIGVMLERKGIIMNHKKLYRLYTEEKLGVRRRRGRERARGSRTPMADALRPGERWSLDFLSDTFGASRRFRILAVNDDCCRENLCLMADTGKRGPKPAHEVVRALPGREERRPPPPEGMTEAQANLWRAITETEPGNWFDSAARQSLLRLYCEHACFRADLQRLIDRTPVEKIVDEDSAKSFEAMLRARDREMKQLVSLATRMRLTNQSRYTPGAAGSAGKNNPTGPKPWEDDPSREYFS